MIPRYFTVKFYKTTWKLGELVDGFDKTTQEQKTVTSCSFKITLLFQFYTRTDQEQLILYPLYKESLFLWRNFYYARHANVGLAMSLDRDS